MRQKLYLIFSIGLITYLCIAHTTEFLVCLFLGLVILAILIILAGWFNKRMRDKINANRGFLPTPPPAEAAKPADDAPVPAPALEPAFIQYIGATRDLNKEAWCWHHLTSGTFYQAAVDAFQAVVDYLPKYGYPADRVEHLYEPMSEIFACRWLSYLNLLKSGIFKNPPDYPGMLEVESWLNDTGQTMVHSEKWSEYREDPRYQELSSRAKRYISHICHALKPGLYGGLAWLDPEYEISPDQPYGPQAEEICDFLIHDKFCGWAPDDFTHLKEHPAPEIFPHFAPDMSLPVKTGEIVPWTGVWMPAEMLEADKWERFSFTFAIKGQVMTPAWRLAQSVKEQEEEILKQPGYWRDEFGDVVAKNNKAMIAGDDEDDDEDEDEEIIRFEPKYEITATTWYPLLEVESKKTESREAPPRGTGFNL